MQLFDLTGKVAIITGSTKGIGEAIAHRYAEHGARVVISSRKADACERVAAEVNAKWGKIDILVCNAAINPVFGSMSQISDEAFDKIMGANVKSNHQLCNLVIPEMVERKDGSIVIVSSIGGLRAFPALGYYNASKFAVEGLSEALWQEVEPLGIRVMLVEPSGFRTDWAGRSAGESAVEIDDYAGTAGVLRRQIRGNSGQQPGDPVRAAQAIVSAVESGSPPHHLLLGNAAYDLATAKLAELEREFAAGEAVARGADFPKD